MDFAEEIRHAVAICKVLLAVIGPEWLTVTDGRGRRRLDDPADIVRLEIEDALDRGVRVIPILVDGASMPDREDLPGSLAGLARRNALFIRHENFRSDAGRLVTAIEPVLAATSETARKETDNTAEVTELSGMSSQLGLSARLPSVSDSTCPREGAEPRRSLPGL